MSDRFDIPSTSVFDKYAHLPYNRKLAIYLIASKGLVHNLTLTQIAEECDVTLATLWNWRADTMFNDALLALTKELHRSLIPKLLQRLAREIDTAPSREITNIAKVLLQYQGELTDKSEVKVTNETITVDDIIANLPTPKKLKEIKPPK